MVAHASFMELKGVSYKELPSILFPFVVTPQCIINNDLLQRRSGACKSCNAFEVIYWGGEPFPLMILSKKKSYNELKLYMHATEHEEDMHITLNCMCLLVTTTHVLAPGWGIFARVLQIGTIIAQNTNMSPVFNNASVYRCWPWYLFQVKQSF